VNVTATSISNGDDDADHDDADHDDAGDDTGDGSHDNMASCSDRSSYSEMSAHSNDSRSASPASPNTQAT
jgi:hypothetical protein